jgi:hypothetical protein
MSESTPCLTIARKLATASPQAMLPCPVCAASLRGENLERHLDGKHPGAASVDSTTDLVWRGVDRTLAA